MKNFLIYLIKPKIGTPWDFFKLCIFIYCASLVCGRIKSWTWCSFAVAYCWQFWWGFQAPVDSRSCPCLPSSCPVEMTVEHLKCHLWKHFNSGTTFSVFLPNFSFRFPIWHLINKKNEIKLSWTNQAINFLTIDI